MDSKQGHHEHREAGEVTHAQPPIAPPLIPPRPSRSKTPMAASTSAATIPAVSGTDPVHDTASSEAPAFPVVPPRPGRNKSAQPPQADVDFPSFTTSAQQVPEIPPRPTRPGEDKSAHYRQLNEQQEHHPIVHFKDEDDVPEHQIASIPADMTVHAPIAVGSTLPGRPGVLRSMGTSSTASVSKPSAKQSFDCGIPQIGRRVPLLSNAGDVQAPTPTPSAQSNASAGKKLSRASSPYSLKKEDYGEYGSSLHPLERRSGHYSLSHEDLNNIVAQTAKTPEPGESAGIPDEELGWKASEEYARQFVSPPPIDGTADEKSATPRPSASPTRDGSSTPEITIHVEPHLPHVRSGSHPYGHNNYDFTRSPISLGTPGAGSISGTAQGSVADEEEYGQRPGEFLDEIHSSGTPILASDEIKRRKQATPLEPAISPVLTPRRPASRNSGAHHITISASAPAGPVLDIPESALSSLELVQEHQPLFPDEEESSPEKPQRPPLDPTKTSSSRRFPSKDIWEDAPPSSHLEAAVTEEQVQSAGAEGEDEEVDEETAKLVGGAKLKKVRGLQRPPLISHESAGSSTSSRRFPSNDIWEEAPESSQLTATVTPAESVHEEEDTTSPTTIPQGAVSLLGLGVASDRATTGAVLEDARASNTYRTSTGAPLEGLAILPEKPQVPARPSGVTAGAGPIFPTGRPVVKGKQGSKEEELSSPVEKRAPPVLPERPAQKPTIPQRPAKIMSKAPAPQPTKEDAIEAQSPGGSSTSKPTPPVVKPKPMVPPRVGGKIAALTANLGLEKRLAAGPMGFMKKKEEELKKEEQEEKPAEPVVILDVRKGRAKGPRGRKPPTAAATEKKEDDKAEAEHLANPAAVQNNFSFAWTVWSVDAEGEAVILKSEGQGKKEEVETLAKEVYTEVVNPPVVGLSPAETEESVCSPGTIPDSEHPQGAAPEGEPKLGMEEMEGKKDIAPESTAARLGEEEGDWDVVVKE